MAGEVERRLRVGLAKVPSRHPLLMAVSHRDADAVSVVVGVDIDEEVPATACYRMPRIKSDVTVDVSLIVGNPDRIVDAAGELTRYVVRSYERELRRRIIAAELPNYVGLRGALPASADLERVGGIDEVEFPGWQSQIVSGAPDAYSGLLELDSLCYRGWAFPDLTIVDRKTYFEVVARFQTQQRFWTVLGGAPMLAFMRGLSTRRCRLSQERPSPYIPLISSFNARLSMWRSD